jgi:hypothetical protein
VVVALSGSTEVVDTTGAEAARAAGGALSSKLAAATIEPITTVR